LARPTSPRYLFGNPPSTEPTGSVFAGVGQDFEGKRSGVSDSFDKTDPFTS
jgi:hypothetical protein